MTLNWIETENNHGELALVAAVMDSAEESRLQLAVDQAIEYAVQLMTKNVRDESRYFICEWDIQEKVLNVVVTDENKSNESPVSLELKLPGIEQENSTELIKFWITDYLSTCSDFLRFSVIALFHTGDRNRGTLL